MTDERPAGIIPRVFENFSERGRQTIVLAQAEARELQHSYIGTEHLLLGILMEGGGVAVDVLDSLGVTGDRARAEVVRMAGSGPDPVAGQKPFTPRTRDVLLRANRIRLSLGADAVEPEHLLLALVRDDGGVAIRVLTRFGVDPETIRTHVTRAGSDPPRVN